MKIFKAVCLCAMLGLPTLFFGQVNEPIYSKNAKWIYLHFDGQPGIILPDTYIYSGKDTVFNGKLYHTRDGGRAYRNDSNKVFTLKYQDSSETLEYDFGLNVLDTFISKHHPQPFIVTQTDSVLYHGKKHKIIFFNWVNAWIEGIGVINGAGSVDGGFHLCQFFLNDTLVYINRPYCGGIGIAEAPLEKSQVKCYPNPASNVITIESSTKIETAEVCDMLGKTILRTMLPAGISEVNISSLSSGVFYLKSNAGVLGKFVVY